MNRFFNKVAQHLDKLDAESVRGQYKGLVQEFTLLETVFRALGEGVIVASAEGLLVYANPAAERLAHFEFSSAKNAPLVDVLPGWNVADLLSPPSDVQWSRAAMREITQTYPERRILEVQAMPNGEATILIVRDVTLAHAREADALESSRIEAIQQLASGVAHEIGNPLNALSLNLDLLARDLRKEPDPDRRARLLTDVETAKREVKRIDAINRGFLNALRPVKPVLKPGNLADPLKATLEELKPRFADRAIRVALDLPSALPSVIFDEGQLQQVFFNLIKNALEAMKDGGALAIAIDVTDAEVAISFRDTGSGIPAADLGRLFEPYHTTKGELGNGLGLMMCRRIVRAHGGEIDVESKEGEGTRFTVRLPRLEKRVRRLT
ncbi:MAG: ATP-binding protein [Kiritimatiellae bacterium]|nr:ATP-binding protein [Kiritimatiellia bacterium]